MNITPSMNDAWPADQFRVATWLSPQAHSPFIFSQKLLATIPNVTVRYDIYEYIAPDNPADTLQTTYGATARVAYTTPPCTVDHVSATPCNLTVTMTVPGDCLAPNVQYLAIPKISSVAAGQLQSYTTTRPHPNHPASDLIVAYQMGAVVQDDQKEWTTVDLVPDASLSANRTPAASDHFDAWCACQ